MHLAFKPLNAELNPICHLLSLLGAHHILHVSRLRVKVVHTVWKQPLNLTQVRLPVSVLAVSVVWWLPGRANVVSSNSLVTACRGVWVLFSWLVGNAFVSFAVATIKASFLLLSSPTALTAIFVLDDKLLGSMRFIRRLVILVDL